ncbi:MAG: hypothetical protein QM784_37080 [Polyangiaceae bacterium]
MAIVPAWLSLSANAEARIYYYPPAELGGAAVAAYVHKDPNDGGGTHWIAWFPRAQALNCNYVIWTQIGATTLYDWTTIEGSTGDDFLTDIQSPTTICGYAAYPITPGSSYNLTLAGVDGNDTVYGTNVYQLNGGTGNDFIASKGSTGRVYIEGFTGNDNFCGYGTGSQEGYNGHFLSGNASCAWDQNGSYYGQWNNEEFYTGATRRCGC